MKSASADALLASSGLNIELGSEMFEKSLLLTWLRAA